MRYILTPLVRHTSNVPFLKFCLLDPYQTLSWNKSSTQKKKLSYLHPEEQYLLFSSVSDKMWWEEEKFFCPHSFLLLHLLYILWFSSLILDDPFCINSAVLQSHPSNMVDFHKPNLVYGLFVYFHMISRLKHQTYPSLFLLWPDVLRKNEKQNRSITHTHKNK